MRFVKEEDHAWLFQIAHFGQLLKQLRQHPEQEGGIDRGALDQTLAGEDVDIAAAIETGAHPVTDIQFRLTEEDLAALLLKGQQCALDGADAGGGDIAVHGGKLGPVLTHKLQHGTQVLQIQQQQAMVIGHAERNIQDTGLNLRQTEKAPQQSRAHLRHGDAHRMPVFPKDIPETGGITLQVEALQAEAFDPGTHVFRIHTGNAHTTQVALHIRQEHGNTHIGETFGHNLHGDGLAGTGRAGNQAVAVGHLRKQIEVFVRLGKKNLSIA